MKSSHRLFSMLPKGLFAVCGLCALLAILASACNKSSIVTQATLDVQPTLDVDQTATLGAQQTAAAKSTQAVSSTAQSRTATREAQQVTLSAQQTILAEQATQIALPTSTPVPTETPVPPSPTPTEVHFEPVILTDWKLGYFYKVTTGCYFEGQDCWIANDSNDRELYEADMTLTTRDTIYIDPSWPNPYMLFWHTYRTDHYIDVFCIVDSLKDLVFHIAFQGWGGEGNARQRWSQVAARLEKYKDQSVTIRFIAAGRLTLRDTKTEWRIQDIKIVPDYQP